MKIIAGLAFILAAAPAAAETIYKYVAADGSVTYSSYPVTGAAPAKRLTLDPETNVVHPPPARSAVDESQRLAELQTQRKVREIARQEVILAQQALAAAEAALAAGLEPLPGERRGACVANGTSAGNCVTVNANGMAVQGNFTSRLTEGYDERIFGLETEVEKAGRRLQEALAKERGY
ncbi:MAG: DUF4124 domain-containing protein [Burkholderiales bacterium]